ncbi:MAG: sporulation inhibitor of replication protein SirA [Mycoplasmatota bacterium]
MRTFHLFLIKKDKASMYENNEFVLYTTLKNLYTSKTNLNFSYIIYNQICDPFKKEVIVNYFAKKGYIRKNNIFALLNETEMSLIKINYSHIILKTNNNYSSMFKILQLINKNIFIVDFNNNDYFFIKKYNHILEQIK